MTMTQQPDKLVYTPKEVAQAMDCHVMTIYRMMDAGQLVPDSVGSQYRIPLRELQRAFPSTFTSDNSR